METENQTATGPDWDRVELVYRAGIIPEGVICQQFDISRATLDEAVKSRGWTRTLLTPEDEATILTIAEYPKFPCDSIFEAGDFKRKALMTAGEIIRMHRKDVGRMRDTASQIMEQLESFMSTGDISPLLPFLGKNDSATDLLSKLSNILTKIVSIEREAYGLASMTINNDEEAASEMNTAIGQLSEQLKRITQQKAQKAEFKEEGDGGANSGD